MQLSRKLVLLLSAIVVTITSIGMSSFSLFLPPMEAEGMSFIVHQIGSAGSPMLASLAFDMTGSYDGFMVAMGVILVASGALIQRSGRSNLHSPEPIVAGGLKPTYTTPST